MKKNKLSIITGSILAFVLIGGLYQNCGSSGKKKSLTSGSTSGSQLTSGSVSGSTSTSTSGNTGSTGVNTSINTSVDTSVNTTVNTSVGISTTNTSTTFNTTVNTTASTTAATSGSTSGGGGPNPNSPVCPHYPTFEGCVREVITTANAKHKINDITTACNNSYAVRKKYKNPNYTESEVCVNIFRRINPEGTANPVPCFTVKDPNSCAGSCWRFTGYDDDRPVNDGLGRPEKSGTAFDLVTGGEGGRFNPLYDPLWLNMGGSGVESATPDDGKCTECPAQFGGSSPTFTDPDDTNYLYVHNKKKNPAYMTFPEAQLGMVADPANCCQPASQLCAHEQVDWMSSKTTYPDVKFCPGTKAKGTGGTGCLLDPDPAGAVCGPYKSDFNPGTTPSRGGGTCVAPVPAVP